MLLAHTPVLPPMSPPTSHRRHPSAPPAVVVQPTKVPGILSISKPLRTDPRHHHHPQSHTRHPHRSPRPKHAQPPPPHSHEDAGKQEKPSSEVTLPPVVEKPSAHPLPEKARGRQSKASKDKGATRSSSLHRNTNPATNSFDPFVLPSDSDSDNSRHPFWSNRGPTKSTPTPTPSPSGKIARRRHHTVQEPATPTPAPRPVPVPRGKPTQKTNLSRSAPSPQALPPVDRRRASVGHALDFPVCVEFFGFSPKHFGSLGSSATRAAKDKAGFFASSVFQNSPSPDELPPPAF